MKPLIVYTTKSGATRECAKILANQLHCPMLDLKEGIPDILSYDTIILGTGVRMGKIYKPAIRFINQNLPTLSKKKIAIFFCNAYSNNFPRVIEKNLPLVLQQQAITIASFGGKPPFTKPQTKDWLQTESLNTFIKSIQTF